MLYTFRKYHDDHRPYKLFQMIFCITLFYMSGFLFIQDHEVVLQTTITEEEFPFPIGAQYTNAGIYNTFNGTNATKTIIKPVYELNRDVTYNDSTNCFDNDAIACNYYFYSNQGWEITVEHSAVQHHTTSVIAEPHIMFIFGTMYTGLGTLMIALTIGETFSLSYWALTGRRDY